MNSYYNSDTKLSVLSNIVNVKELETKFPGNKKIIYKHSPSVFFKDFDVRVVREHDSYKNGTRVTKIEREPLDSWGKFKPELLYDARDIERHSISKDFYIQQQADSKFFLTIKPHDDQKIKERVYKSLPKTQLALNDSSESDIDKKRRKRFKEAIELRDHIWEAIEGHTNHPLKDYNAVEVPEEFKELMKKRAEAAEEAEKQDEMESLSPAERRELLGKTVCYSFKKNHAGYPSSISDEWKLSKKEPVLKDLKAFDYPTIYGTSKDDDKLKVFAALFENFHRDWAKDQCKFSKINNYSEKTRKLKPPAILRFSKRNLKHVRDKENFVTVDDAIMKTEGDTIHLGQPIYEYETGRRLEKILFSEKDSSIKPYTFLKHMENIDKEACELYTFLEDYHRKKYLNHYSGVLERSSVFKSIQEKVDKVYKFQVFVENNKEATEEEIQTQALLIFDDKNIRKAHGIELRVLNAAEELLSFAEPLKDLLMHANSAIFSNENVVNQVKAVLKHEGLDSFSFTENTLELIQQKEEENNE